MTFRNSTGHDWRARMSAGLASHWVRCAFLLIVGFVVRMPALQGLPIWDDEWLIKENPFIRSPLLIGETFRHFLFLDGFSLHYRPVQNVSYTLDYLLWNADPYGYHLSNVLLHIASGVLLYFLLRKIIAQLFAPPNEWTTSVASFLIALLWVVHPVHSAAIDYISGRADSLAFLFASGAWLLCYRAAAQTTLPSRTVSYLAAGICGLLSLCSREIGFVWIFLFLLHTFCFQSGLTRRAKLVTLAACVLLLGSYIALRQLPQRPTEQAAEPSAVTAPERAVLMLRALGDYTRLMVFPKTLCMERTVREMRNFQSTASWRESVSAEYLSILGLCSLGLVIWSASRRGAARNLRIFGALWFICAYLPISNIVDLNANVAEHWLYLPSVGFLMLIAGLVLDFPRFARRVCVALACLAACGLSLRAYQRSTDWVTPKIFFQRTIAAGGASIRPAVNLALIYALEGDLIRAEKLFRRVLELVPDYPVARNGLADVCYKLGKEAESRAMFVASRDAAVQSRREYPNTWIAALNLSRMQHKNGDDPAALALLDKARADYPHIWEIISYESEILRERKDLTGATRLVAEFSRDNWWHHDSSVALGHLLAERGDLEQAVDILQFASWLDVHDASALNFVAWIRQRQGRLAEARVAQERAVRRQPDEPRQYVLLSGILHQMGRDADAELAMARVECLEAIARAEHVTAN